MNSLILLQKSGYEFITVCLVLAFGYGTDKVDSTYL